MTGTRVTLFVGLAALAATLSTALLGRWVPLAPLGILAIATGLMAWKAPVQRLPLPAIGLAGVCGMGALQIGAGLTANVVATAVESLNWLVLALIYATAAAWFSMERERNLFLRLFAFAAGATAAYTLVQPYAGNLGLAQFAASADVMAGPFRNRNTYASFVELALPVAVWAARKYGPQWWLAAAALLASALVTGSRAGAALAVVEAGVLALWLKNTRVGMAFAGAAALGMVWGGDTLATRINYRDPLDHRREIYAASLELASAKPMAGWGLGTFEQVYPQEARFDIGKTINHVHSDWLEAAVEGGLPFAAAVAALTMVLLWRSAPCMWACGLFFVVLHSFVDFPFQRIGITSWFFLIAGAAEARRMEGPSPGGGGRGGNAPEKALFASSRPGLAVRAAPVWIRMSRRRMRLRFAAISKSRKERRKAYRRTSDDRVRDSRSVSRHG